MRWEPPPASDWAFFDAIRRVVRLQLLIALNTPVVTSRP